MIRVLVVQVRNGKNVITRLFRKMLVLSERRESKEKKCHYPDPDPKS